MLTTVAEVLKLNVKEFKKQRSYSFANITNPQKTFTAPTKPKTIMDMVLHSGVNNSFASRKVRALIDTKVRRAPTAISKPLRYLPILAEISKMRILSVVVVSSRSSFTRRGR